MKLSMMTWQSALSLFLCLFPFSSAVKQVVLGTFNENSLRVTSLESQNAVTTAHPHSFPVEGYNRSSDVPLSHTRRSIPGADHEGILLEGTYLISYKNGTFQNFTLPCRSHELYEAVGLESSAVQIITCRNESTVLVVSVDDHGTYTVKTRIVSDHKTSSAAILIREGTSTALYISLSDNALLYYSLTPNSLETPYYFITLDQCSDWEALSYSDTRVAFHCLSNNQLYIVAGSGNGDLFKPLFTTENVVLLRNKGLAASITDSGVEFFMNDFFSSTSISIPIQRIEYIIVDDIAGFFLFHENGMKVYYLNTSYPLNIDSLELIVNTSTGNPIDLDTFYIYPNSMVPLFAYFTPPSTIHVIDYVTNISPTTVHQQPKPWLIDIWEKQVIVSTTIPISPSSIIPTSSHGSTSSSGNSISSTTTTNTTLPTTSTINDTTTSPPPTVQSSSINKTIIGVGVAIAFVLIVVLVLFVPFLLYTKKKGLHSITSRLSFRLSSVGSSPSSSVPDIAMPVEVTDCSYTEETGLGPDAPAF